MPSEEKQRLRAQKILDRAELYLTKEFHEKAFREFLKAGELFFGLEEYRIAEQCYFFAAKALVHEGYYMEASKNMRSSANCCVLDENYMKAGDYYDIAAKYALKSEKKHSEFHSILSACFAYLCWFLIGQQEKGLAFIKRIKKNVDSKEFAENNLVRLVKGLTLAILNHDDSALQVLEKEFFKFKFQPSETKLITNSLLMAKTHIILKTELTTELDEMLNEQTLDFSLNVDISGLKAIEKDKFFKHKFKSLKITEAAVELSDNMSLNNKPVLPLQLQDEITVVKFGARANFPGDSKIGPISFSLELDDTFCYKHKTNHKYIVVKSPPTQLGINLKPISNPIINQTFALEIQISNSSESDAVNIMLAFEFPDSLRLMRGTTEKKIYQLIRNEEFTWQLSLKPLEPGIHIIKATVSFNDQDGNQIGPDTKELPFEINL